MTFTSPVEPAGRWSVQAVNLENGSTYTNPNYNTIRLILDGNSPSCSALHRWTAKNAMQVRQAWGRPSPSSSKIPLTHLAS